MGSKTQCEQDNSDNLVWLEEEPEPDLSSATPLQVLEYIAVHGKSETARVQALKVLVDRQHQLERERTEREQPDRVRVASNASWVMERS